MFHIKTDIRQYKCETTAKVERLIRNWVIRPSDLIYNAEDKTWSPIGQHPAFNDIFAVIEQEEANEPDTIVTDAPSEVAAEHEVEPGAELEDELDDEFEDELAADGGGLQAASEEITNVRPAPSGPDGEGLSADSEEITNVTEAPSEPSEEDASGDPADEQDAHPAPPEAPEDVEGVIRDSDEITMMTDKTLEMMREEASPGEAASPKEEAAPDEETQVVERDEFFDDEDEAAEQDAELAAEEDEAAEADEEQEGDEGDEGDEEKSGKGRHGLPEEIFVTDEIPRQNVEQAVLDELGELEEDVDIDEDVEDDEVTEVVDQEQKRPRWRIVMSDDVDEDEIAEQAVETADEADSVDEPIEDAVEETLEEASDEDLDEMLDEAAELVGLGEDSDPIDIDGGALEPLEDAPADEEPRQRAETPVQKVEIEEFISEGYKLPLPVDISPSAEDIRLGLKHSRVSRKIKDAVFPYPQPKKKGEVATRVFDLDPEEPKDHSLIIVAAFVIGMLLLVVGAVTVLG